MTKFLGKRVLVTGHTGFKGAWLVSWLKSLGAELVGIGLDPETSPSHFSAANLSEKIVDNRLDMREREAVIELILKQQPDFVFHMAAQAIVRKSHEYPLATIETNAIGTVNLLEALRLLTNPVVAIFVTSDKVYENVEQIWGYRETDRIGGKDPYSASKGMAELAIRAYIETFFESRQSNVRIGIARAGNVIGGGDWSDDRIVPDCVRAWMSQSIPSIRNPRSTRPWQHVLEPLNGYLMLALKLSENSELHGEAFNFGPWPSHDYSVHQLVDSLSQYLDNASILECQNISDANLVEANLLKLDCEKAMKILNWSPVLTFDEMVRMTIEWYLHYYKKPDDIHEMTMKQIYEFGLLATQRGLQSALL
jgi:CDP-glucose 4,6-dehydratase